MQLAALRTLALTMEAQMGRKELRPPCAAEQGTVAVTAGAGAGAENE